MLLIVTNSISLYSTYLLLNSDDTDRIYILQNTIIKWAVEYINLTKNIITQ